MLFLERVRQSIVHHTLLAPGTTLLIAVSGGADSLALMLALYHLRQTLAINLHIVTVDHGWRGEASAADADFVVELVTSLDMPVTRQKLNLGAVTSNLEAVSRQARYKCFATVAHEHGIETVAVGHHADDQAETILMRLLRGTGLDGLQGMQWQSPMPYAPDLTLIRPLLGVTRTEIESFCEESGITPRIDETNDDVNYLRNYIRLEILPQLQKINPKIGEGLVKLGDIAAIEADYLARETNVLIQANSVHKSNKWLFPKAKFSALHPAIQRRVIRELVSRVQPDEAWVTYEQVVAAQQVCLRGQQGAVSEFSGQVHVRVAYDLLVFERDDSQPIDTLLIRMASDEHVDIRLNEPVLLENGTLLITNEPDDAVGILGELYLPDQTVLQLRTRHGGDRIALPGLNGKTQKIKDWMINRKIPQPHRNHIPLLMVDGAIVAILHHQLGVVAHPFHRLIDSHHRYFIVWTMG